MDESGEHPPAMGLPSRLRVLSTFEQWWEELERVLYSDTERATLCLHCLARIIDDCYSTEEEAWEVKAMAGEEPASDYLLVSRLMGVVMTEFADVADAAFQLMTNTSNPAYLRAMLRLMLAVKQACWKTGDDFHIPFPQDGLENFIQEQVTAATIASDALIESRLAFLAGEQVEETNGELPFAPLPLIQIAMGRFMQAKSELQSHMDDVVALTQVQRQRANYVKNTNIPIPTPESVTAADLVNFCIDFEAEAGTVEHAMVVASGNLRFLAATADCMEALQPSIEADMIGSCLELLDCPHFPLQLFSMGWFVGALTHKKVAAELVERNGMYKILHLVALVERNRPLLSLIGPYASFVLVALSKHSQPMEALVEDYATAETLISFAVNLFHDTNMDPKLNIVEFFGEAFGHPLLLLAAQKIGVIPLISVQLKHVLTVESEDAKKGPMRAAFIKEAVRTLLKYANALLYWAVEHSKGSVLEAGRHYVASDSGVRAQSCHIVRVDDQQAQGLERSALKYIAINNQVLPGMRMDLMSRFREDKETAGSSAAAAAASAAGGSASHVHASHNLHQQSPVTVDSAPGNGSSSNGHLHLSLVDPDREIEDFHVSLAAHFPRKTDDDNVSVSSQVRSLTAEWTVAKVFIDYDIIPILLSLVNTETKDSTVHTLCLQTLELLCLDAACVVEIQHCQPFVLLQSLHPSMNTAEGMTKKGMEILLNILSPHVRRDPNVIIGTLRVMTAMCTPPLYRCNGSNASEYDKFLQDFGHKMTDQANGLGISNSAVFSKRRSQQESAKKSRFVRNAVQSKLDMAQSSARVGVRVFSGISSLVQLICYKRNQLFARQVRQETIKILIGLAHDKEINQILSKMRVETIVHDQLRGDLQNNSLADNGRQPTGYANEKAFLTIFTDILFEAISANANISDRVLDATQQALIRKRVVDKSHVDFDEGELMELIKDHLASKGLTQTVAVLQEELRGLHAQGSQLPSHALPSSHGTSQLQRHPPLQSQPLSSTAATAEEPHRQPASSQSGQPSSLFGSPLPSSLLATSTPAASSSAASAVLPKKRQRSNSGDLAERADASMAPSGSVSFSSTTAAVAATPLSSAMDSARKVQRKFSHEQTGPAAPPEQLPLSRQNSFQSALSSSAAALHHNAGLATTTWALPSRTVPLSRYQRSKNILQARKQASYVGLASQPRSSAAQVQPSSLPALQSPEPSSHRLAVTHVRTTKVETHPQAKPASSTSKLSNIMHRYLKLQHSQCKHPVTTLPLQSLVKPHICPRPQQIHNTHTNNVYSLVGPKFSFMNAQWYNPIRMENNLRMLRYLYSSYRPVRTARYVEQDLPLTACAFSRDPLKVYLGYGMEWNSTGPGIAMMDFLTGMQESITPTDLADMDVTISRIYLSPNASQSPVILVSTANEGSMPGADHKVYAWKDLGDTIETFEARHLHQFCITLTSDQAREMSADPSANEVVMFYDECFSPSGCSLAVAFSKDTFQYNKVEPFSVAILDVATGATIVNLLDHQPSNSVSTYDVTNLRYLPDQENMLLFDGKLWDVRTPQLVHRFDKLSSDGCTAAHPFKPEIIIDSAVWDLRNYSLLQTVPMLDGFQVEFGGFGHQHYPVLFARRKPVFNDLSTPTESNFFHVLDSQQYEHLHTECTDKEDMPLLDLQLDRSGLGYMCTFSANNNESVVRVVEVGRRKVQHGSDDEDDDDDLEDEEDDEDWHRDRDHDSYHPMDDDDEDEEDDEDYEDDDLGEIGSLDSHESEGSYDGLASEGESTYYSEQSGWDSIADEDDEDYEEMDSGPRTRSARRTSSNEEPSLQGASAEEERPEGEDEEGWETVSDEEDDSDSNHR